MNILFLDVDGVLNTSKRKTYLQRLMKKGEITRKEFFDTWDLPYSDTMNNLKKLVDKYKFKIVLISSWRQYPDKLRKLKKVFKEYGLGIYSQVDNYVDLFFVDMDKNKIININKIQERTTDKGALIQKWLNEHKKVKPFLIISDTIEDIKEY